MPDKTARETLANGTAVFVSRTHRFGSEALMLADFCGLHRLWAACDLGSGCGIIPLFWHDRGHRGPCFGIELDEDGTALLRRGIEAAGAPQITALTADLRHLPASVPAGVFDVVSCNPPFYTSGPLPPDGVRAAARHETACTIADVCAAASRLLKSGGRLCLCAPPQRLCDVLAAMRGAGIEPKRLRFVRQKRGQGVPWLFLADGRRQGRSGLLLEEDLITEEDGGGFSDPMLKIFREGACPE